MNTRQTISDKKLREMLKGHLEAAKTNLIQNKSLMPVAIILSESQPAVVGFDNSDKTQAYSLVGLTAAKMNGHSLIIINDIAMRKIDWQGLTEEEIDKILADPTEHPLTYPKSLRTDGILVHYIDLWSDRQMAYILPYVEDEENNGYKFKRLRVLKGEMSGYLPETVKEMYNRSIQMLKNPSFKTMSDLLMKGFQIT